MNRDRDIKDVNRMHDLFESLMTHSEAGKVFDDIEDEFDGYKTKDVLGLEKRLKADVAHRSLVLSWLGTWKKEVSRKEI